MVNLACRFQQFFAYSYEEKFEDDDNRWDVYNVELEFNRQGVPNDKWRITNANEKYELCDTYPKLVSYFVWQL